MRYTAFLILLIISVLNADAQLRNTRFTATAPVPPVEVAADAGLGISQIYIFNTLSGAAVSYTAANTKHVNIYTYQTALNDKTEVPSSDIISSPAGGNIVYTVRNLQDNRGLVIDEDGSFKVVWIIDYSKHLPQLNSLTAVESEDRCSALKLVVDKNDVLEYKGTAGQTRQIKRVYDISYDVLTWDDDRFVKSMHTIEDIGVGVEVFLDKVPNMDTQFEISGDQFGKKFGIPVVRTSDVYKAVSVEAKMLTKQYTESEDEIIEEGLGGSAPVEIDFWGFANEPVADYYAWYIFDKKDMNNPVARYADKDMNYVFNASGDYMVRFEVANTSSGCVDSLSVAVSISESDIKAPNFITPRSPTGTNTVFKFTYKSIIKFKCTIFNRWGNKVYEWTDPSQGWDGRYKGKLVNPGVYYYVLDAVGSDNIRYKRGGDINVF